MGNNLCWYLNLRIGLVKLCKALLRIPDWLDRRFEILVVLFGCFLLGLLFVQLITCLNLCLSLDVSLVSFELACCVFFPLLLGLHDEFFACFLPILGFLDFASSDLACFLLEGLSPHDVLL